MTKSAFQDGVIAELARGVDEVAAHAAAKEQARAGVTYEPPRRGTPRWLLPGLSVVLVAVWSWSIWTLTRPTPPLPESQATAELQAFTAVIVEEVEAVLEESGEYPQDLEALGYGAGDGVRYAHTAGGYELLVRDGDVVVVHGSGDSMAGIASGLDPEARGVVR